MYTLDYDIETGGEPRLSSWEVAYRRFLAEFRVEYADDGKTFKIFDRQNGQEVGGGASLPWQARDIW